jgi:hypothetical protein
MPERREAPQAEGDPPMNDDRYRQFVERLHLRGQRPSRDQIALLFAISLGVASALLVACAIAVLDGCSADWNAPRPIVAELGNPCGMDWHSCNNGKCCYDSDDCRPAGGCAFGGLQGPTWGAKIPDAGAEQYPQQTPGQIYRRRGY